MRAAAALAAVAVALAASPAGAGTRRLAVVVGHNVGGREAPLRYAEADAVKFARVLTEVGGVDRADLDLLLGRPLADVRAALDRARRKIAEWRKQPDERVLIFFYFSGHSDGQALELAGEGLDFGALRNLLAATGADVQLAIVDTCRSGALVAVKGGQPGPGFQIRLDDEDLRSSGYVFLTSSAGDELALESPEIHGSFFTHHLISGLLGQADVSGDRRVSLGEAYDYAYARTVADTARTTINTQHPNYRNQLTGHGELVLTELQARSAQLVLPTGFDRMLVTGLGPEPVLAEVAPGMAPRPLALMPGNYAVRARRGPHAFAVRVALAAGQTRTVTADELAPTSATEARSKGDLDLVAPGRQPSPLPTLEAAAGARYGVFPGVDGAGLIRVAVRGRGASGFTVATEVTSGWGSAFVETTAFVGAGYHLGVERGRFRVFAGVEAGAGFAVRSMNAGAHVWSPLVGGAPHAGASLRLSDRLAIALSADVAVYWVRDGHTDSAAVLPGGRLGLLVDL